MNKRIKELVEKSKEYATESTKNFTGDEPIGFMDFYTEKFAQLIVKETIDHMTAQMFYYSINGSKNLSFSQAIDKTKEHFGVEE